MNGNVIRTITVRGTSEGLDKVTADINKLAAAEQNVAVVSEQSAKRVLSLEDAWKRQTLKLDEAARAQANYSREAKVADAALRQGLVTQQQHAERLDLINQKYNQGSAAQKAFATATSGVSGQLVAMSAGAGPVGVFLSALGPWGMAAAVGLGAVSSAFNYLIDGANRLGDKSIEVRKFAEVTGLTVSQIKALKSEGGKLGIGSDEITSGIEKFTVGLAEARKGTGALFEQVRAINPVLAQQLAATTNAAEGWDVLGQAMKATTDQSQKAALSRASFGRGGIELGLLAGKTSDAGGIVAMGDAIARNTGLTDEWVKKTAQLRAENVQLEKQIQTMKESVYAREILQIQNDRLKTEKAITEEFLRRRSVMGRGGQGVGGDDDAAAAREAAANRLGGRRGREAAAIATAVDPAVIAGWQQLDDAIAGAAASGEKAVKSLTQLQNEAALALNKERERVGLLGDAATEQEKLNVKTLELRAALLANKLTQDEFNRALAAQTTASDQMLKTLQQEGQLIRASADEERDRIKAQQTYQSLIDKKVDATKAAAIASQQLSNANEARWRAEERAAENAVKSIRTAEDAWNAYAQGVISWSVANDEAGKAAQKFRGEVTGLTAAIKANNAALQEATKFVPFGTTWAGMGGTGLGTGDSQWKSNQGGVSQFNPAGYTSTRVDFQGLSGSDPAAMKSMFGPGGSTRSTSYSPVFGNQGGAVPNQQGFAYQIGQGINRTIEEGLTGGVGYGGIIGQLLGPDSGLASTNPLAVQNTAQMLARLTNLLPEDQQAGSLQGQIDILQRQPVTLARDELIKSLTDQLKQLQAATEDNTDALNTQADPLFSQGHEYLNSLKIGYYKAATGLSGLVTGTGGTDSTPVHMMLTPGEHVQVTPGGTQHGVANDNSKTVTQNITQNITINTTPADRLTGRQRAQGFITAAMRAAG